MKYTLRVYQCKQFFLAFLYIAVVVFSQLVSIAHEQQASKEVWNKRDYQHQLIHAKTRQCGPGARMDTSPPRLLKTMAYPFLRQNVM